MEAIKKHIVREFFLPNPLVSTAMRLIHILGNSPIIVIIYFPKDFSCLPRIKGKITSYPKYIAFSMNQH